MNCHGDYDSGYGPNILLGVDGKHRLVGNGAVVLLPFKLTHQYRQEGNFFRLEDKGDSSGEHGNGGVLFILHDDSLEERKTELFTRRHTASASSNKETRAKWLVDAVSGNVTYEASTYSFFVEWGIPTEINWGIPTEINEGFTVVVARLNGTKERKRATVKKVAITTTVDLPVFSL
jgi:hypothetical protein